MYSSLTSGWVQMNYFYIDRWSSRNNYLLYAIPMMACPHLSLFPSAAQQQITPVNLQHDFDDDTLPEYPSPSSKQQLHHDHPQHLWYLHHHLLKNQTYLTQHLKLLPLWYNIQEQVKFIHHNAFHLHLVPVKATQVYYYNSLRTLAMHILMQLDRYKIFIYI